MAEVGSAFVTLLPSARDFGSKMDGQLGGQVAASGKRMGSRMGTAVKLGAVGAMAGVVAYLGDSLKSLGRIETINTQTATVIKSTGGAAGVTAKHVEDLAGALENSTAAEAEATQEGANFLLTFKNIRNEAGKGNDIFDQTTKAMVDLSRATGTDAKAASLQLGKALNDPIKGVSALGRVGITFTEQQKAQIKGMVESGKTMDAQRIILGELESQFGGSGEAFAKTTQGQIELAEHAFGTLGETVSAALLPPLGMVAGKTADLLNGMAESWGPFAASVGSALAPVREYVGDLWAGFGGGGRATGVLRGAVDTVVALFQGQAVPVLREMAETFTTVVVPALLSVVKYVAGNLVPIFQRVAGIITTQVVPIVAMLGKWLFGTLYPAVVAIAVGIGKQLVPVFDAVYSAISGSVLPAVSKLLARFKQWLPTIAMVVTVVVKVVGAVLKLAAAILGKVLPPLIKFTAWLAGKLVGAVSVVVGWLIKIIGWVVSFGVKVYEAGKKVAAFVGALRDKFGEAVAYVKGIPGRVSDALGNLGTLLKDKGTALIQGLIDGISEKMKALTDKMGEIAGAVGDFFPGSPVKRGPLRSWNRGNAGKRLVGMLADGLGDTSAVDKAMYGLTSGMTLRAPRMDVAPGAGAARGGGALIGNLSVTTPQGSTAHDVVSQVMYQVRQVQRAERWA